MSGREAILGRVRAAIADVPTEEAAAFDPDAPEPGARYARTGTLGPAARLALFVERAGDYRAEVTVCADDPVAIARTVGAACARHQAKRLVVPDGLDLAWIPTAIDPPSDDPDTPDAACLSAAIEVVVDDPPLAPRDLAACDGVITGCELAIAVTGTVVLATGPAQGRRATTLLPDLHVCVVRADQIVETVPEAIARLAAPIAARRAITFVSGPSATSDIELKRVEGVHGPRRLELVVADGGV
jgi:L-lactate dehydrogenase complex protein LldG